MNITEKELSETSISLIKRKPYSYENGKHSKKITLNGDVILKITGMQDNVISSIVDTLNGAYSEGVISMMSSLNCTLKQE